MLSFPIEPGLQESWLSGGVLSAALVRPVVDARIVCDWTEQEVRALRDSLQSVFEQWRNEKGTLPDGSHGGLLGNSYAGKTLAECPPYACMGERSAGYTDLLTKLRDEQYPPLLELEAEADNLRNPPPTLPDHIPRLPEAVVKATTKPGMQRILVALILSEAAAGNVESATKAHWSLSRIRDKNERRVSKTMLEGQKVIHEFALTGIKFRKGRKVNSVGPIRKAIARELNKNPALWPRQIWGILASKPPKGWEFFDNSAGKYIEGPKGGEGMGYAHFSAVCKQESDKLAP